MENYEEFKNQVYVLTKIDLSSYKEKQMRRRIESLAMKHECKTLQDYAALIKSEKTIFEEFVNFLTINVSEFYRNPEQWKMIVEDYLPKLIQRFGKSLKVWSAACSTGDEPYSLVMALSELIELNNIRITATDIDKQVIAQAKTGIYSSKSIVAVPDHFKKKYFEQIGDDSFKIDPEIKRHVDFREHNLLRDNYIKDCHFIVCRNVLIYFTEEAKREIYRKFAESLRPGGVLFIGSTEQISDYRSMGLVRGSSFFYEKAQT